MSLRGVLDEKPIAFSDCVYTNGESIRCCSVGSNRDSTLRIVIRNLAPLAYTQAGIAINVVRLVYLGELIWLEETS